MLSATLTNQSVAQRPPVRLVLVLCTPHPHEGHSVAGAPLSWLQEQAQIPLTWKARVLQGPRLGDHLAQHPDPGKGGFRVAGAVTGADAGIWSGKAKQEEERQVAKKPQLEDPATPPLFHQRPWTPPSIPTFLLGGKSSLPSEAQECERLWGGNKDPGENEMTSGNHRPAGSSFRFLPEKGGQGVSTRIKSPH